MDADTYARLLRHARRVCPPDPALDAEDLVQQAWVKAHKWLDGDRSESDRMKYLYTAVTSVALDSRRRTKRRAIGGTVDEWFPDPARFEDVALDRVTLAPLLDEALQSRAGLAVLLIGMGHTWDDATARAGVGRIGVHRYRQAHKEA